MTTFAICYDLNREGSNYGAASKALIGAIVEHFPTYWHYLDSTWLVVTDLSAAQIRNLLSPFIDSNDELLVMCCGPEGAWKGFNENGSTWLKSNL